MLTDIKMLFFNIRHTYLLASPPESQTTLDYRRQCHDEPPAPQSGSKQWCHIRHCSKSTTSIWIPLPGFKAPVLGIKFLPFLHRKIQNAAFSSSSKNVDSNWVSRVKTITLSPPKQIVIEVATSLPLAPPSYRSKNRAAPMFLLLSALWKAIHVMTWAEKFHIRASPYNFWEICHLSGPLKTSLKSLSSWVYFGNFWKDRKILRVLNNLRIMLRPFICTVVEAEVCCPNLPSETRTHSLSCQKGWTPMAFSWGPHKMFPRKPPNLGSHPSLEGHPQPMIDPCMGLKV